MEKFTFDIHPNGGLTVLIFSISMDFSSSINSRSGSCAGFWRWLAVVFSASATLNQQQ
jgi:hypothetical protein